MLLFTLSVSETACIRVICMDRSGPSMLLCAMRTVLLLHGSGTQRSRRFNTGVTKIVLAYRGGARVTCERPDLCCGCPCPQLISSAAFGATQTDDEVSTPCIYLKPVQMFSHDLYCPAYSSSVFFSWIWCLPACSPASSKRRITKFLIANSPEIW